MSRSRGKVTDRGQVTIPKGIRRQLGVRPGDHLEFEVLDGGRLMARKAVDRDPVDAAYGVLTLPGGTDAFLDSVRGEPDPA